MADYVFDACALIALADDEEGADLLEDYLASEDSVCYVHSLNFCEVYYHAHRLGSEKEAKDLIEEFLGLGFVERNDLDKEFWQHAGDLKSVHKKVSLADCAAIALALRLDAVLVSSDHHELDALAERGICRIEFFR